MNESIIDDSGNIIDYYMLLKVSQDSGKDVIRASFRNLIKLCHPDISGKNSDEDRKQVDLLIKGYKVLLNDKSRAEYNRLLSKIQNQKAISRYLPKTRIRYSMSLKELLAKRILVKHLKRKDRASSFGQDIEIFITGKESLAGAAALIELPARVHCSVCYGRNPYCHACGGLGRIFTRSHLEVNIPPGTKNGSAIEFDLTRIHPDKFTSFTVKTLRIKIVVAQNIE